MSFLNLFSSFLMVSMLASAQPAPAIFDVLRSGRTAELSKLLKSGQAANARDRYGMAPLHYAAAYGSLGDVETLLAAGAAVNAATPAGATALMCATGDTAKLKALLAAGADVNMTAKSGATAVLAAAIRGNAEAVRMLLAAGADRGGRVGLIPNSPIRLGLTQLAYFSNDPELRGVLNEPQKKPDVRDLVAIPGSTPLAGAFVLKSFSMRPYSRPGVDEALRAALALGADPNADIRQLTRQLPPLALAATVNDPGAVRTLLQAGAEPNRAGTQGVTPLMLAASAEDPSVEIVELLLGAGAKVEAKDAQGRTAVDWALLQGESAVSRLLVAKGGAPRASLPLAPAVARPVREARNAMEVALQKLHASGAEFHRKTGCISCHHQSLPAVAGQLAQKAGVGVDAKGVAQATEASFSMWSPSRENFLMGNCSIMGFLGNVGYGLFGMAEQGVAPNEITDAAAYCLSSLQGAAGEWEGGDMRPPLAGRTPLVYTALAVRGLRAYMPPALGKQTERQVVRAREYLRSAVATDTQGEAFRLLGLVWSGGAKGDIAASAAAEAAAAGRGMGAAGGDGAGCIRYRSGGLCFAGERDAGEFRRCEGGGGISAAYPGGGRDVVCTVEDAGLSTAGGERVPAWAARVYLGGGNGLGGDGAGG